VRLSFSDSVAYFDQSGFTHVQTAVIFSKLMSRLGYGRYIGQGGDWGAYVTTNLALVDPKHCIGKMKCLSGGFCGNS
jgi:microsomal epoxide hydrolase